MQYSRYDCQKRRILDWNSGRRSRLQSWPTQQYLEIALIVWHQMVQIEYFYERLETPRPPRKVTLSKNWQCQQQHSTSGTQTYRVFLWQRQKSEDSPQVQDGSKHILEDQATGSSLLLQWMRFTLVMSTSLRVHFQMETRIIKLLNELKLVQRKLYSRRSGEGKRWLKSRVHSSRQDMANVELIELRTSEIHQCPSCGHAVFKETILCTCGKHIRPNQEMIQRIRAAFQFSKHLLSARLQFLQEVRSMVINHGSYLLRKQKVFELSFRRQEYHQFDLCRPPEI